MRRTRWSFLVLLVLAIGACSDETTAPDETTVTVRDDMFDPSSVNVGVGDEVTWQWSGQNQHNVTWVVPGGAANSATQTSGTFSRTFGAAGTFEYYCTVHGTATTGMRGSIVVQ
jgi:plastocyanin